MKTVPIFQETVLLHSGISHSAQTQITCNRPQLQAVTSRLIRVLCWRSRRTVFLPLLQKRRLTVVSDSVAFMPTWVTGKAQYRLTFPTVHSTVSASKDVCVSDGESFHRSHLHWFNWSRVKEHFSVFSLFWLYYMLGLEDVDQNINKNSYFYCKSDLCVYIYLCIYGMYIYINKIPPMKLLQKKIQF